MIVLQLVLAIFVSVFAAQTIECYGELDCIKMQEHLPEGQGGTFQRSNEILVRQKAKRWLLATVASLVLFLVSFFV